MGWWLLARLAAQRQLEAALAALPWLLVVRTSYPLPVGLAFLRLFLPMTPPVKWYGPGGSAQCEAPGPYSFICRWSLWKAAAGVSPPLGR